MQDVRPLGRAPQLGNAVTWFEVGAADDQPLVAFYGELFDWELRPAAEGYTMVDTAAVWGSTAGSAEAEPASRGRHFTSRPTTRGTSSSGPDRLAPRPSSR